MESGDFCNMKGCQLIRDDHPIYLKKTEETDVWSLTNIIYTQKLKDFFPLKIFYNFHSFIWILSHNVTGNPLFNL